MQVMKVNHPLHLQLLPFDLAEYTPYYQVPVHYILGAADTIAPTSLGPVSYTNLEEWLNQDFWGVSNRVHFFEERMYGMNNIDIIEPIRTVLEEYFG